MVTIRKLEKTEHLLTKQLYEAAFPEDKGAFSDYYYEFKAVNNTIYAALETGKNDGSGNMAVRSMLHLNPVNMRIFSERRNIPYIVAVATDENYRRRGLMRKLMEKSLNDLNAEKVPFTFLMPADEEIYKPFGFRSAWPWVWENDVCDDRSGGIDRQIWLCDDAIVEVLCRNVNRRLAQLYDVFTYRTVKYYRTLDYEQKASGGEVRIIFDDKEQPISGECTFREDFPPMMRRITNFSAYIALVHAQSPDEFLWKIVDPLIQENNGLYKVTLGRSESRAVKLEEDKIRSGEEESIQQINIADVPQYLGQEDPLHRCCVSEVV